MKEITDYEPTHEYFHHYRTVNAFIDHVSLRLVMLLQGQGYDTIAIPASQSVNTDETHYEGLFQHRTSARMAGLGWIGKNGSLVNPKYGPRVRLGTVLTDLPLNYGEAMDISKCGTCEACVLKCPAMVLTGEAWSLDKPREFIYDPEVCSKHMSTHYKHIGRGVVCGICLKACPVGKEQ
jgi:epoxyqueuosine reductase QueG